MNPNTNIAVSVIVPAYNSGLTLEPALNSLVNQTLKPIEIICVNDGSTDNTLNVLEEYRERHPGVIQIISCPNSGAFNARNIGIDAARGQYVAFCDADDLADSHMLDKLYSTAKENEADIAICSFCRTKNGIASAKEMDWGDTNKKVNSSSGWLASINTSCWNKLIKTDLAKKHVALNSRPKITEDAIFLLSIYPYAGSIAFTSEPLYYYREDGNTAMSSITDTDIEAITDSWKELRTSIERQAESFLDIIDSAAFIHLGVSVPLIVAKTRPGDLKRTVKQTKKTLDISFPKYKDGRFLSMGKAFKEPKHYLFPYIALLTYKTGIFSFALTAYNRLTKFFKLEAKW